MPSAPRWGNPPPAVAAVIERQILMTMTAEAVRRQASHSAGGRHARRPPSAPFPRLLPLVVTTAIAGTLAVCAGFGYLLSSIRTTLASPHQSPRRPRPGPPGRRRPASRLRQPERLPGNGQQHHLSEGDAGDAGTPHARRPETCSRGPAGPAERGPDHDPDDKPARLPAPARCSTVRAARSTGGEAIPAAQVAPSEALVGCVLHLTGDVAPMFVDRATYQSEQVYVIAVADEAWVVGIGCTASRPTLITSVQFSSAR